MCMCEYKFYIHTSLLRFRKIFLPVACVCEPEQECVNLVIWMHVCVVFLFDGFFGKILESGQRAVECELSP